MFYFPIISSLLIFFSFIWQFKSSNLLQFQLWYNQTNIYPTTDRMGWGSVHSTQRAYLSHINLSSLTTHLRTWTRHKASLRLHSTARSVYKHNSIKRVIPLLSNKHQSKNTKKWKLHEMLKYASSILHCFLIFYMDQTLALNY